MSDQFRCPTCAHPLSPNARSCGRCGTRREGGTWFAPASADGLGIDDEPFAYDDFIRREFGEGEKGTGRFIGWFTRMSAKERFWWVVAVVTLAAFAVLAFRW
jgi:hypothetical protein